MNKPPQRGYEFGPFHLDVVERLLLREGEVVPLAPKDFDLLLTLVEQHGRVLEKEELMRAVWPDSFVEEANLSHHVFTLRKALGEDTNGHRYIETMPRRGYRFVASVQTVGDESDDSIREESAPSRVVIEPELDLRAEGLSGEVRPLVARRWTKFGGIVTVAMLVIGAIAAMFFLPRRSPTLTDKDTVLLADFVNTTGDEVFDSTLKQALAHQLRQSPFLSIFSDERVREALRYMGRSPDERVTRTVAREICERQGLKALLIGSIASFGRHYAITVEAFNAQTGDVLASEQVEAESKEQILKALGRAATQLREKLGESLSSIQQFDVPLEQATTSSLEALKAFSQGYELLLAGKMREAISPLKRAIELDPNFALAYFRLEVASRNMRQLEIAAEYARKAFELREPTSEREKLMISLSYYTSGTWELDKQIEVAELLRRNYPREYEPPNSLSIRYRDAGQYEKAVAEARAAIRLNPHWVHPYSNLGLALIKLNRFAEAKEIYEHALEQKLDSSSYHSGLYAIAFVQGDHAAMQQQIDWAVGKPDEYAAFEWQAQTAVFAGRLRQAREFLRHAIDLAESRNFKEVMTRLSPASAMSDATLGHCQQIRRALALARGMPAARALALCGEIGQAQSRADELAAQFPRHTLRTAIDLPLIRAAIELQRRDPDKAIQLLQPSQRYEGTGGFWPVYLRGQAYLLKRSGTEAAAEFQKILDHRGWDPTSYLYPLAHLRLAQAAALAGDTAKSRKAYEEFFALWKDADPDIPILQEAKKEYGKLK